MALDPLRLVDRDEICLLLAAANCERLGGVAITRHCESVALQHVTEVDAWHLDPDRRTGDARTSRAELAEPGLETIEQLRQANPHGAIKLAPAAEAPEVWQEAGNREWIETRGECRQQMVWLGSLASEPGSSQATLLDVATGEAASFRGDATIPLSVADSIGPFVFDPAPSLVAARLTGALAEVLGLASLAAQSLYLTGPHAVQHPLLQSFAVEAEMPLDVRQLRSYFQLRGVGRLEIKKRGVTLTPETLRPQLQLRGDAAATLLLTRIGQRTTALVCQRI